MADVISIRSNDSSYESSEYEVEKILNERTKTVYNKKTKVTSLKKEYKVKWVGYARPTWEPESNLFNCAKLLTEYNQKKKEKENKIMNKYKHPLIDLSCNKKSEFTTYSSIKRKKKEKKIKEEKKHSEHKENHKENRSSERCEAPPARTPLPIKSEHNNNINNIDNNKFNGLIFKNKELDDSDNLITLEEFAGIEPLDKSLGIKKEKFYDEDTKETKKEIKKEKKKKKKLNIIEISNVRVPDDLNEKFKLSIKYKSRENNQINTNEFESNDRSIRRDVLIKYYENILFKNKKGENIIEPMTFNISK